MELPDVNVLVYALRVDTAHHTACKAWLDGAVAGEAQFALSRLALSAAVRIATSPKIFSTPSSLDDAFGFCADLVANPNCQLVEPGARHWDIFRRLCTQANITGPRVTDAWCAALAIEHGCDWITMDRDFARFPGLKWRRPEAA